VHARCYCGTPFESYARVSSSRRSAACSNEHTYCDKLFAKTVSLAPEGFRDKLQAKKADSIAKCEKMSASLVSARGCYDPEALQKCPPH